MAGGVLISVFCAYIGVFIILKRIVFVGVAISEAAALGVAIGLFTGINIYACAFLFTFLSVIFFWARFSERTGERESLIGFMYVFSAALSVILLSKNPIAEAMGIDLVSGNLLYMTWADIYILGFFAMGTAILHILFFKEFIFLSFDPETAFTSGINTRCKDFLLYLTIGIIISVSMKSSGVIFVFSSLIIPAMCGLLVAKSIKGIFICSITVAVLSVFLGLIFSFKFDLPSSPLITVIYGVLFILLYVGKAFSNLRG